MEPEKQRKDLKRRAVVYLPLLALVLLCTYLHLITFLVIILPLVIGSWWEFHLLLMRESSPNNRFGNAVWAAELWLGHLGSYIYLYSLGWYWVLYPILIAASSDTGGYIGGRYGYGKDEEKQIILPSISRSKTVIGTLCGILFGIFVGLVFWLSLYGWPESQLNGQWNVICAILTVLAAQWGDFDISRIKRQTPAIFQREDDVVGLKDSHEIWADRHPQVFELLNRLGQGGFCDRTQSHAYATIIAAFFIWLGRHIIQQGGIGQ